MVIDKLKRTQSIPIYRAAKGCAEKSCTAFLVLPQSMLTHLLSRVDFKKVM